MSGFVPDVQSQDWCTPTWILDAVRAAFGVLQIDLDPCSNDTSLVGARVEYKVPANNGLEDSWDFPTVFVNPPFGTSRMHRERRDFVGPAQWKGMSKEQRAEYDVTSIADWLRRCMWSSQEYGSQVIALVPVTPETKGWLQGVWPHASGICFFDRRLKFIDFHTKKESPQVIPKPMAIVYWAGDTGLEGYNRFESVFRNHGNVIPVGPVLFDLQVNQSALRSHVARLEERLVDGIVSHIKTLDTRNATVLSIEGDVAYEIDMATLAKIRERLRANNAIPEGTPILVLPDGEINSYDASQLQVIIDRLCTMRDAAANAADDQPAAT